METRLGQSWVGSPGRKVRGPGSIKGRSNGCGTGCRVGFVFTKLLRNSETEALFPENSCFSSPRSSGGWGHLCTSTLPALLLLSKAACSLCWSFGHMTPSPSLIGGRREWGKLRSPHQSPPGSPRRGYISPKKRRGTPAEATTAEWWCLTVDCPFFRTCVAMVTGCRGRGSYFSLSDFSLGERGGDMGWGKEPLPSALR